MRYLIQKINETAKEFLKEIQDWEQDWEQYRGPDPRDETTNVLCDIVKYCEQGLNIKPIEREVRSCSLYKYSPYKKLEPRIEAAIKAVITALYEEAANEELNKKFEPEGQDEDG